MSAMSVADWIQSVVALVTAGGVCVAAYQLLEAKRQAQLQFEDSLNEQYRGLLSQLPLAAMLGKQLSPTDLSGSLPAFFRYFDLSNEQGYLRKRGRIRDEVWRSWLEGIQQNMARPAFSQAWQAMLPDLDGSFDELKAILADLEEGLTSGAG